MAATRHGYLVSSNDKSSELCESRMDAIVALEFALSRRLATSMSEYVHLHASGAVVGGKGVLALGASGAGKSSLAVSMLARDHPTLGDDIVMLGADANVTPFKRLLKVSPEVLGELGVDPADTVFWDAAWPEAWYEPPTHPGWAGESPVAFLVLPHYDRTSSTHLIPMSRSEALNVALHSVMVTGIPAGEGFDRLLRMVERAKTFRLTFRSSIEAADALCCLTK